MVARILMRVGLPKNAAALDVGCGTGGTFELFNRLGTDSNTGVDIVWDAVRTAKDKWTSAWVVQADASKPLPFREESFDLVTVFGVLHHVWIRDEVATLRQLATLMKPKGLIAITEPAFPILTRRLDNIVMTKRRYLAREITEMAHCAGLVPVRTGYFAFSAFLPVLAVALMERFFRRRRNDDHNSDSSSVPMDFRMPPSWLNRLFLTLTDLEGRAIAAGFIFPVGITIIGVYQKV